MSNQVFGNTCCIFSCCYPSSPNYHRKNKVLPDRTKPRSPFRCYHPISEDPCGKKIPFPSSIPRGNRYSPREWEYKFESFKKEKVKDLIQSEENADALESKVKKIQIFPAIAPDKEEESSLTNTEDSQPHITQAIAQGVFKIAKSTPLVKSVSQYFLAPSADSPEETPDGKHLPKKASTLQFVKERDAYEWGKKRSKFAEIELAYSENQWRHQKNLLLMKRV